MCAKREQNGFLRAPEGPERGQHRFLRAPEGLGRGQHRFLRVRERRAGDRSGGRGAQERAEGPGTRFERRTEGPEGGVFRGAVQSSVMSA
jgi:hypothetical protein